jgi:hypothetical protein
VKVCGTGRLRDCVRYREGGAVNALDFVDLGYPTTYGLSGDAAILILRCLIQEAALAGDFVFVELGGDLLEAGAPYMIAATEATQACGVVLCVNDAMGALEGLRRLNEVGVREVWIVSLRQNAHALSERLCGTPVFDLLKTADVTMLGQRVFGTMGIT